MPQPKHNILFIMFDQLRWDYLSCAGHPHLKTPHIDKLAKMGVRFTNAYVQSTICGASRMSFYTGRYVHSHGAAWNNFPLKVGELTIGDHLRALGMQSHLVGKTHMKADADGMERLGISENTVIGARTAQCGFDVYVRDDGLWAQGPDGFYDNNRSPYNEFLKSRGYDTANPWHDHANSAIDQDGNVASGWLMTNADQAANIREKDSETPWLTDQAINFMQDKSDDVEPWMCHLSYIKPHWPYIVPAPYHNMYAPNQIIPVNRTSDELNRANPVYQAFTENNAGRAFAKDAVRNKVIPAYMGLIKQCDDQMGRLFDWMEKTGRMDDTMIILTSDHGDYLGDHWLGEKDLFHDCSVKVPMIIYDPSAQADSTRGTTSNQLVEAIDLAPTFVEKAGGQIADHILEGRSLLPLLHREKPAEWRKFVVSEYDYSSTPAAEKLGLSARHARLFMLANHRWKFIHAEGGLPPMLFDLKNDPQELHDIADEPANQKVISKMYTQLGKWARRMSQRTTISDSQIKYNRQNPKNVGILIGAYDGQDVASTALEKYLTKGVKNFTSQTNDD